VLTIKDSDARVCDSLSARAASTRCAGDCRRIARSTSVAAAEAVSLIVQSNLQ